jgi:hypothetical protein
LDEIQHAVSSWAIHRRQQDLDDRTGPHHLAMLHARAEAVWLYWNIWVRRRSAPYAILLQDHGSGMN